MPPFYLVFRPLDVASLALSQLTDYRSPGTLVPSKLLLFFTPRFRSNATFDIAKTTLVKREAVILNLNIIEKTK